MILLFLRTVSSQNIYSIYHCSKTPLFDQSLNSSVLEMHRAQSLSIPSTPPTNGFTKPAWQGVEAHCTCLSIVAKHTTSSPSVVLSIGNWVIGKGLHIGSELLQWTEFTSIDYWIWGDKIPYVWCPKIDGDSSWIKGIEQLLSLIHIWRCRRRG